MNQQIQIIEMDQVNISASETPHLSLENDQSVRGDKKHLREDSIFDDEPLQQKYLQTVHKLSKVQPYRPNRGDDDTNETAQTTSGHQRRLERLSRQLASDNSANSFKTQQFRHQPNDQQTSALPTHLRDSQKNQTFMKELQASEMIGNQYASLQRIVTQVNFNQQNQEKHPLRNKNVTKSQPKALTNYFFSQRINADGAQQQPQPAALNSQYFNLTDSSYNQINLDKHLVKQELKKQKRNSVEFRSHAQQPLQPESGNITVTRTDVQRVIKNEKLSKEILIANPTLRKELKQSQFSILRLNKAKKDELTSTSQQNLHSSLSQMEQVTEPDEKKDSNEQLPLLPFLFRQSQNQGLQYNNQNSKQRIEHIQTQDDEPKPEQSELKLGLMQASVLTENRFQNATSGKPIKIRAVEQWINQTLREAQMMEIPGSIRNDNNQDPIQRYGLDRITMSNAGLSNQECDNIYRSLYVYTVGFYESVKFNIGKNTSQANTLKLTLNLWSVFQLLIEFACKTEYRMLISQATSENEANMKALIAENQKALESEKQQKEQLRHNMEVMQNYVDKLEKDRNNEKSLRLKLEEEFMTILRNHEEEVVLRLEFEKKLNQVNSEFRNLEIQHQRLILQLGNSESNRELSEEQVKQQSLELIELRNLKSEQTQELALLRDSQNEVKSLVHKKNLMIQQIQDERKAAVDRADSLNFEFQKINDQFRMLELRSSQLEDHNKENQFKLERANQKIRFLENENLKLSKSQQAAQNQLELSQHDFQKKHQEYESLQIHKEDSQKIIEKLMQELSLVKMTQEDFSGQAIHYKAKYEALHFEYLQLQVNHDIAVRDLANVNQARHVLLNLSSKQSNQVHGLEDQTAEQEKQIIEQHIELGDFKQALQACKSTIQIQTEQIDTLHAKKYEEGQKHQNTISTLQQRLSDLQEAMRKQDLFVKKQRDRINQQREEMDQNEKVIREQLVKNENLNVKIDIKNKEIQSEIEKTKAAKRQQQAAEDRFKQLSDTSQVLAIKQQKETTLIKQKLNQALSQIQLLKEQTSMQVEDFHAQCAAYKRHKDWADSVYDEFLYAQEHNSYYKEVELCSKKMQLANTRLVQELAELSCLYIEERQLFESVVLKIVKNEDKRFQEMNQQHTDDYNEQEYELEQTQEALKNQKVKVMTQQQELKQLLRKLDMQWKANKGVKEQTRSSMYSDASAGQTQGVRQEYSPESQSQSKQRKKRVIEKQDLGVYVLDAGKTQKSPEEKEKTKGGRLRQIAKESADAKLKLQKANEQMFGKDNKRSYGSQMAGEIGRNLIANQLLLEQHTLESARKRVLNHRVSDEQEPSDDRSRSLSNSQESGRINFQKLKFQSYRAYLASQVESSIQKIMDECDPSEKYQRNLPEITQRVFEDLIQIQQGQGLPQEYRNLILTEEQKEIIQNDLRVHIAKFRIDNLLPDSDDSSEVVEDKKEVLEEIMAEIKRGASQIAKAVFKEFYDTSQNILEEMVKENQKRMWNLAKQRRQSSFNPNQALDHVKGRNANYHFLLRFNTQAGEDNYERHKQRYLNALNEAIRNSQDGMSRGSLATPSSQNRKSRTQERHEEQLAQTFVSQARLQRRITIGSLSPQKKPLNNTEDLKNPRKVLSEPLEDQSLHKQTSEKIKLNLHNLSSRHQPHSEVPEEQQQEESDSSQSQKRVLSKEEVLQAQVEAEEVAQQQQEEKKYLESQIIKVESKDDPLLQLTLDIVDPKKAAPKEEGQLATLEGKEQTDKFETLNLSKPISIPENQTTQHEIEQRINYSDDLVQNVQQHMRNKSNITTSNSLQSQSEFYRGLSQIAMGGPIYIDQKQKTAPPSKPTKSKASIRSIIRVVDSRKDYL